MIGNVHLPAAYDEDVLLAFRALFDGVASEGQQKRAMSWLVSNACHIGTLSYGATDRDTSFLEGQRSIGLQVAKFREAESLALIKRIKAARPKRKSRQEAKP